MARKRSSDFGKKSRKRCPIQTSGIKKVDYKDIELLSNFITERGKILPRRITGTSQRNQRLVTAAIKRARYMALLPFVGEN
ncbi:MAG: 30S ribosomal protein S18 [Chlamydiia bacterium]|nr:30S ribosomal protein S18 [Chlamydiia bacterium]